MAARAAALPLLLLLVVVGAASASRLGPADHAVPAHRHGRTPPRAAGDRAAHQAARARYWRKVAGRISCQHTGFGPSGGFCLDHLGPVGNNADIDPKFAAELTKVIPEGTTVVDLGCGFGQYGRYFRENGAKLTWHGFDGSERVEEATQGFVRFFDLGELEPLDVPGPPLSSAHWRMSVEVAEHLPQRLEGFFMYHVLGSGAPAPDGIVLTWAVVGQGGHGHVNCQNREYVVCLMEKVMGYREDTEATEQLRSSIAPPHFDGVPNPNGSPTWWLQNTVFAFRRTEGEAAWPAEARARARAMTPGDERALDGFSRAYRAAVEAQGCVAHPETPEGTGR